MIKGTYPRANKDRRKKVVQTYKTSLIGYRIGPKAFPSTKRILCRSM